MRQYATSMSRLRRTCRGRCYAQLSQVDLEAALLLGKLLPWRLLSWLSYHQPSHVAAAEVAVHNLLVRCVRATW